VASLLLTGCGFAQEPLAWLPAENKNMNPSLEPTAEESLDQLTYDWKIFQLRKGHRFSTDDVVTAWRASVHRPDGATRLLDLGTGIGSVGLTTLYLCKDPAARLLGIEAQEISLPLHRKTLALNGLESVASLVHGDIRDPSVLPEGSQFDLITGSPPYTPETNGVVPQHTQKAHCRFELRGSVAVYAEAARRFLAPGGRFVYVMLAADPRTEAAAVDNGFTILECMNVVFREGRAPLIKTIVAARNEDGPHPPRKDYTFTIRDADGNWTDEYNELRHLIGLVKPADRLPEDERPERVEVRG